VGVKALDQRLNTGKPTRTCNPDWVKAQVLVNNLAQSAMTQPQSTGATALKHHSEARPFNSQPQQLAANSHVTAIQPASIDKTDFVPLCRNSKAGLFCPCHHP
jgi:hypothetical protein